MEKRQEGLRDPSLDGLLDLDGQVLVLDEEARFWVKFEVRLVVATPQRPHGLDYSLNCMEKRMNGW